jgi:hypothetical protein
VVWIPAAAAAPAYPFERFAVPAGSGLGMAAVYVRDLPGRSAGVRTSRPSSGVHSVGEYHRPVPASRFRRIMAFRLRYRRFSSPSMQKNF